ncbi:aldehyde dehydrogenase family protein [Porticoccaceae bacterium]|nr:aldehyde dehydrogenase family protein [Porticoccaceae bacterium]
MAQEEIFGPVLSVIGFKDEAEAIAIANNNTFGLAAYVATQNLERVRYLGDELRLAVTQMIVTDMPSGGNLSISIKACKQSGVGFESGVCGLGESTVVSAVICFT